jgi:hypothetical protein
MFLMISSTLCQTHESEAEAYLIIFRRQFIEDIERVGERKEVEHDGVQIHLIWV